MGNRITRTVLFAASALLSVSAFGAGAARLGTLRNADWVVTNAWQAVSNKTHDLIIDLGQEASLPPNWLNVSNAAMSAVQSLQPATNYTDRVADEFGDGTRVAQKALYADEAIFAESAAHAQDAHAAYVLAGYGETYEWPDLLQASTSAAKAVADAKISTNNAAFVAAVLAAPLAGANADDLSEIAEYGSYGTVGAALLALIAGLAALKRRMATAETSISGKLDGARAYPEWDGTLEYVSGDLVWYDGAVWVAVEDIPQASPGPGDNSSWARNFGNLYSKILEKQDALTAAQLANIAAVPGKANASDVTAALAAKADAADLRYALYTAALDTYTAWTVGWTGDSGRADMIWEEDSWKLIGSYDGVFLGGDETSTDFEGEAPSYGFDTYSATRSLAYGLHDRASNAVTLSADAALALPPAVSGHVRDLIVRMTVSTSAVVTFSAQAGETVAWDSSGDPSGTRASGTHLLRLTEVAQGVWHAEDMNALDGIEAALAAINGGVAP